MSLQATTSQTVGPYFAIGLTRLNKSSLVGPGVSGEQMTISGRVLDADGIGVPDAVLEIWQANSHGKYAHPEDKQDKPLDPNFHGYGRIPTDGNGAFRFTTIKPGPVPGPDGSGSEKRLQAPHIVVSVFSRGLLRRLVTRIYFPDEAANAGDFVLNLVEPARRGTLIAKKTAGQRGILEWNVILHGADETVFFDIGL
ncbi:MAG: protocatechuate 3,4-dioxygenase subunit alpha [Candidatus Acidiferrales bacterium]